MYRVFDVTNVEASKPESLGSKEKEWLAPVVGVGSGKLPVLFKIGRPGTGENWAERAAYEIARAISLPAATYELALRNDIQGVVSERMMPMEASLALGNILLPEVVGKYDGTKQFKQKQYTIRSVVSLLSAIEELQPPENTIVGPQRPIDFFIGFLVFDALIGNTDRHHENWGVTVQRAVGGGFISRLAPTFDHASSLGRAELDHVRQMRLDTKDKRADVRAYSTKARSAFYGDGVAPKLLTTHEVVKYLYARFPDSVRFWVDRCSALTVDDFSAIFQNFPMGWLTSTAVEFALKLLVCNQINLKEALHEQ